MNYIATITSKRQFTIPSDLFKIANYKPQQKLLVKLVNADEGIVTIKPMKNLVKKLAGSVKISEKFKGMDIDEMIGLAKFKHFSNFK